MQRKYHLLIGKLLHAINAWSWCPPKLSNQMQVAFNNLILSQK